MRTTIVAAGVLSNNQRATKRGFVPTKGGYIQPNGGYI
jgi:hypothetical protein